MATRPPHSLVRKARVWILSCCLIGSFAGAQPRLTPNEYDFPLQPGATMTIAVSFNSTVENAVSLQDTTQPRGQRFSAWPGCGNFDNVHPKSMQYTNQGTATIPFAINAGYKTIPPGPTSPGTPWNFSEGVVITASPAEVIIGYPNTLTGTGDPSNTEITITVTSGSLPSPPPVTAAVRCPSGAKAGKGQAAKARACQSAKF